MKILIKNENYGYAVATYGDYVVASNPALTRYSSSTPTVYYSGSVDYFRYNKNTDEHDYAGTLYKREITLESLLIRESDSNILTTEDPGDKPATANKELLIDKAAYNKSMEDGFGLSLDMYSKFLVVGSPYYTQGIITTEFVLSASTAEVDVFNLELTEHFSGQQSAGVFSLTDPDYGTAHGHTASFGTSVSINKDWIAVGSPYVSSSNGMVYIYKNLSNGTNYTWSLHQKLKLPTAGASGDKFGYSVKLNKSTDVYSGSLVIGCGNPLSSKVYYFELKDDIWTQTYIFRPDYTVATMPFSDYMPYNPTMNTANGFGSSVSTYGTAVIIGEYLDRSFYEFSGSSLYKQGSVSIFERCENIEDTAFTQVFKTYGNSTVLKNNRMGFCVDMFDGNAVVGVPKDNNFSMTACYIAGNLYQAHQCDYNLNTILNGQAMLLQKNTSSNAWGIRNIYQRKKKYLGAYRDYGNSVAIADKSMVVGAPMLLSESNRQINIKSLPGGVSLADAAKGLSLEDVCGKSYVYNLNNLNDEFHIGNVFYRNGKIVIMTSGSMFDGLMFNPVNTKTYEYDLQFQSQHTIYEKQVVCTVNPGEFNVSTNPSAIVVLTSSIDINKNGNFDFQDVDVVLRYMQYKNTSLLGVPVSTNWTSSIVEEDAEKSLLRLYQSSWIDSDTATKTSGSITKWETSDTSTQHSLDLNGDNRIDINDMNIMWKYFTKGLTQENYASYAPPASTRKNYSDIIDYLDKLTQKSSKPLINPAFFEYERLASLDRTGSFLAPMVTTIGLYCGLDLVCVAKLGSPIKITSELPINFIVKMDY